MSNPVSFLDEVPEIDALSLMIVFIVAPLVPFFITVGCRSRRNYKRHGKTKSIIHNSAYILNKHAGVIGCCNIIFAIIIALSQGIFVYHNLQMGMDISYYMKIDIPEYEAVNNIDAASNLN